MKKVLSTTLLFCLTLSMSNALVAAEYVIDTKGAHAFIDFKIKHLGYSWLSGRFNSFNGEFTYDEKNPNASTVTVNIDTSSIDSNHAERDKHLRNKDFLHTDKYATAKFISKSFKNLEGGKAELVGDLTLHGVTKTVTIDVMHIGHGKDPWGGYRRGFEGKVSLALKDFGIDYKLGPASTHVHLHLGVEGIRK